MLLTPLKKSLLLFLILILNQPCFSSEEQAKIYLNEASKLWSESKFVLADAAFKKALIENATSPKANAHYAGFLLTQNKTLQAIEMYKQAILLDAENPKLFAALSIAYLHQSKYEMATAMANEALRLNPNLKAVKKITEYIGAKKAVIEQASKLSKSDLKPDDAMHNAANIHKPVPQE
jgi:tetratricopeptide (TPR) repeat protein